MPTREILRKDWSSFFENFSRSHRGWLVTIEVLSDELGDQTEVRDLPLEGITAERVGSGQSGIQIVAGALLDQHLSNTIEDPKRVWLKQSDELADEALEIESDRRRTLIRFRSPMRAEMVDGLAAG